MLFLLFANGTHCTPVPIEVASRIYHDWLVYVYLMYFGWTI